MIQRKNTRIWSSHEILHGQRGLGSAYCDHVASWKQEFLGKPVIILSKSVSLRKLVYGDLKKGANCAWRDVGSVEYGHVVIPLDVVADPNFGRDVYIQTLSCFGVTWTWLWVTDFIRVKHL